MLTLLADWIQEQRRKHKAEVIIQWEGADKDISIIQPPDLFVAGFDNFRRIVLPVQKLDVRTIEVSAAKLGQSGVRFLPVTWNIAHPATVTQMAVTDAAGSPLLFLSTPSLPQTLSTGATFTLDHVCITLA